MLEKLKQKFKKKEKVPVPDTGTEKAGKKDRKKRHLPVKQLVILFIVIIVSVILAFFAYQFFVKKKDTAPRYIPKELSHVRLPDEIMEFCFIHLPDLYQSFMVFNDRMTQIDTEITRISEIAKQYPDQKKITDKEITTWEKIRSTLSKEFEKIQAAVREMYVLYRVNPDQGLIQIESGRADLNTAAVNVLTVVQESTKTLETRKKPPEGMVQKIKLTLQKMLQ